jgi:predicted SAM-dependent methyltransferase
LAFCQDKGWKTTGVEPDESARNYAKKTNFISVFDESYFLETGNNKFEVITLWHVLEHVYPLVERIKQIKSLLTEKGLLVVAVPNPNSYDAKLYNEFWAGYDLPRHVYHFGQNQMEELFKRNGFLLKEIVPMKFDSYYVSLLSEKYKSGKSNWVNSLFTGYRSNRFAKNNNNEYSSLIYLFSKEIL